METQHEANLRKLEWAAARWQHNIDICRKGLAMIEVWGGNSEPFEARLREAQKHLAVCLAGLDALKILEA